MKKFLITIIIFITSCSPNLTKNNFKNDLNFSNYMTLNEFKLKLDEYTKNNPYPNIDE